MSERAGDKERWSELWDSAVERAREEERVTILGSAMSNPTAMVGPEGQPVLFGAQDAIYAFLTSGQLVDRADLETLRVVDEAARRVVQSDVPLSAEQRTAVGAIPALEYLGAISGEDFKRWNGEADTRADRQAAMAAQLEQGARETRKRQEERAKARISNPPKPVMKR